MELTDSLKTLFMETAQSLKGSARRLFMARTIKELGPGGQRCAERELGWNRVPSAKARMSYKAASRVSMPFRPEVANVPKTISHIYCLISKPSSRDRAKQTPNFARRVCTLD